MYYTDRVGIEYQLDEIRFADGTIWSWLDAVTQQAVRGTDNGETLKSNSRVGEKVMVYGLGGNDTLFGGSGEDAFVGGPGNDVIYARASNEGAGKKVFVWNEGDGHDTVTYFVRRETGLRQ